MLELDYKIVLGSIASLLAILGYIPYIRDTLRGSTKPHFYTRFIRLFLTGLTYIIQIQDGGGAGAWVTGVTAVICVVITILSLTHGEKDIKKSDKISLLLAILSLIVRGFMDNALYAMMLIIVVECLAFYPTFRKSRYKPYEETASAYFIAGFRSVLAIIALENLTVITILYPLALVIICLGLWGMLLVRRRKGYNLIVK